MLLGGGVLSLFMVSRSHPRSVMCVREQVSVGGCLIEADSLQLRAITGAISDPFTLSPVVRSLQYLPCPGLRIPSVRASWFLRFLSPAVYWTPSPDTWLPIASRRIYYWEIRK